MQDKSSSVGVHTLRKLMNDGDDVLHVNVGSGITKTEYQPTSGVVMMMTLWGAGEYTV